MKVINAKRFVLYMIYEMISVKFNGKVKSIPIDRDKKSIPGWKTSYLNLVTTSETKLESALAKNGTDATNDLQL